MLFSFEDLRGYGIQAADGDIGSVRDVLFEDTTSIVRYLVVETGSWLFGRRVLLAPAAFGAIDHDARVLSTGLTRAQVEDSPGVDTERPVSRQKEEALHRTTAGRPTGTARPPMAWRPLGRFAAARVPPARPEANPVEREVAESRAPAGRSASAQRPRGDRLLRGGDRRRHRPRRGPADRRRGLADRSGSW